MIRKLIPENLGRCRQGHVHSWSNMKAVFALSIVFGVASATTAMAQLPGSFTQAADMATARALHTATLLANGKVLIAGGLASYSGSPLAKAELYDPADGTFSPTGDMSVGRAGHLAAMLANGQVLIASGDSAELYDPATGKFGIPAICVMTSIRTGSTPSWMIVPGSVRSWIP
jgi:hypothetical protein